MGQGGIGVGVRPKGMGNFIGKLSIGFSTGIGTNGGFILPRTPFIEGPSGALLGLPYYTYII